jgi:hypothetical protein
LHFHPFIFTFMKIHLMPSSCCLLMINLTNINRHVVIKLGSRASIYLNTHEDINGRMQLLKLFRVPKIKNKYIMSNLTTMNLIRPQLKSKDKSTRHTHTYGAFIYWFGFITPKHYYLHYSLIKCLCVCVC